ncbi:MAG: guanylate kinase [Gammaproteobacteria bacterium]|nr:guanylate kinase [Gammaproteobacteria bacterium]MDE0651516.1 guanylate kinase [Gammaproteobacteria bacterium]
MTRRARGDGPIVLAGPTGVGKTTVARALATDRDRFVFSVSATTRRPRPGERDGADYEFVSREEFERMVDAGEFAEWARVHDRMYGTPLRNLAGGDGRRVLLDIDVQGAAQVRENVPSAVFVFLLPPSLGTLLARLSGRGTEPRDEVARRLRVARDELARVPEFDHVLVNDELDATVAAVRAIARGGGSAAGSLRAARGTAESLRRGIATLLARDLDILSE